MLRIFVLGGCVAATVLWWSQRLSSDEQALVGDWRMIRTHTNEDGTPGYVEFRLVLKADRSYSWAWSNPDTGEGSPKPSVGTWWLDGGQQPLLNLQPEQPLIKRLFWPLNDSAHYLTIESNDRFLWENTNGPELFERTEQSGP